MVTFPWETMDGKLKKTVSIDINSEHAYVQFIEDSQWLVVATNDKDKPLQLYNYNGQSVGSLGKGEVVPNSTVTYDSNNQWIVTNKGNNIMMFDKDGNLADWNCISSFEMFSGISYHPATGLYLITDLEFHCVLCYDPRGKRVVRTIGSYGRHAENLNSPTLLCGDKLGGSTLLCVSDRKNNQAKLFNIDGQLVEVFGTRRGGGGEGELSHPLGVCMDAKRRVIVCDQLNKRLVRYASTQAADDKYRAPTPRLRKAAPLRGNDLDEKENDEIPEDDGGSDLTSEMSDTDSTVLFDRCPVSATEDKFEELPTRPQSDHSSSEEDVEYGHRSSGDGRWDCLLSAKAFAARVTDLGTFGTRYTSSVDLSSSGMLAVTLYEDCDEQMSIVNLYNGYH